MLTLKHKKLTSITSTNHSYIEWHLTYACPFKCWYCPEPVWNGPLLARYDWEVYSNFLDEVLERYEKGYFLLSGGEPTDWPYFTNVLDKIHNNPNWNVMTLTNLSRSKDFIDQWAHKTDWIVTSFHPNVIKTQAQRDKWFEKALSYKKKTLLNIKILMDPLHWDYCLNKYNSLNIRYFRCLVYSDHKRIWIFLDTLKSKRCHESPRDEIGVVGKLVVISVIW